MLLNESYAKQFESEIQRRSESLNLAIKIRYCSDLDHRGTTNWNPVPESGSMGFFGLLSNDAFDPRLQRKCYMHAHTFENIYIKDTFITILGFWKVPIANEHTL